MKILHLKKFEKDDKTHTEALDKLYSFILIYLSLILYHYLHDPSELKFLRNAVYRHIWALDVPITNSYTTEKHRMLQENFNSDIQAK